MVKSKDWPRVRPDKNGSGQPRRWIVDLRPHGGRKFFSSKDEALDEARIQRIRLQNEGLEGFEFALGQRLDAKIAMAVLAGSGLSLTEAAKVAVRISGGTFEFFARLQCVTS
jgi:hypothetical protein